MFEIPREDLYPEYIKKKRTMVINPIVKRANIK